MKTRLYDGTFGCCWLIAALLGVAVLAACSSSHFQVFRTSTEEDFSKWCEEMRSETDNIAVERIGQWMHDHMKYEKGTKVYWPHYLDAWNQRTNCEGYARVAIECLHRIRHDNYVLFQVDYPGGWHVICVKVDRKLWVSNTGWGIVPYPANQSWAEMAKWINSGWADYKIYSRNLKLTDHFVRP